MDGMGLIMFLFIGGIAGWLGSTIMKGGVVFGALGLSASGMIGSVITATVGAVILLFLVGVIKKG